MCSTKIKENLFDSNDVKLVIVAVSFTCAMTEDLTFPSPTFRRILFKLWTCSEIEVSVDSGHRFQN